MNGVPSGVKVLARLGIEEVSDDSEVAPLSQSSERANGFTFSELVDRAALERNRIFELWQWRHSGMLIVIDDYPSDDKQDKDEAN